MAKWLAFLLFFSMVGVSSSQETSLPIDLRQHNLTEFNSSLFNPVFSLDRNRPQSIAYWSRWQWQAIDPDPTTLFLNYSRSINTKSAIGLGFFQNNTEMFLKTGGVVNYAYSFDFGNNTRLAVGINVFGFQQEFTNPIFQPDPPLPLPELEVNNSFILQFAPGIRLTSNGFGIGIASENLFDYNFANKEAETLSSEKIYIGMMSYDIPITLGSTLENSFLQPNIYLKTIPSGDTQFGLNALLTTSKFWAQSGYNSFYGISVGAGGRFFQKLSLGALVEFGTSPEIKNNDPSFELIAAYSFGKQITAEPIAEEEATEVLLGEEAEKAKEKRMKDKLAKIEATKAEKEANKLAVLEAKQRKEFLRDSLNNAKKQQTLAVSEKLKAQQHLDSINKNKELEAIAAQQRLLEDKRLDSIRSAQLVAEEALKKAAEEKLAADSKQPKTQGRYEEVQKEDGLAPGYYLVANVFGTKKYFDNFMNTLKTRGLAPKSFYRAINKYNYVYLDRYDTLREAEIARDNQFGGKYPDKTWIFRVVGE